MGRCALHADRSIATLQASGESPALSEHRPVNGSCIRFVDKCIGVLAKLFDPFFVSSLCHQFITHGVKKRIYLKDLSGLPQDKSGVSFSLQVAYRLRAVIWLLGALTAGPGRIWICIRLSACGRVGSDAHRTELLIMSLSLD